MTFSYVRSSPITPTVLHRQEHGERLPELVVQPGGADLLVDDGVGGLRRMASALGGRPAPRMRMASPGPGNGWRLTMLVRDPEHAAELRAPRP